MFPWVPEKKVTFSVDSSGTAKRKGERALAMWYLSFLRASTLVKKKIEEKFGRRKRIKEKSPLHPLL